MIPERCGFKDGYFLCVTKLILYVLKSLLAVCLMCLQSEPGLGPNTLETPTRLRDGGDSGVSGDSGSTDQTWTPVPGDTAYSQENEHTEDSRETVETQELGRHQT